MSLTFVGSTTYSANNGAPPTHQAGDLILILAGRGASVTAPTRPAGYLAVETESNSTAVTCVGVLGWKIATSTSDASGTWTNASELIIAVYRPSSGNTVRVGQSAVNKSTTATVNYPALTMADPTSGNSWVLGFVFSSNITQAITAAPTGMSNRTSVVGTTYQAALQDTNGGVSSWSSQNANVTGSGSTVTLMVEIVLAPSNTSIGHIYQHLGGGGNPSGRNIGGNNFKYPLPTPSGAGNTLVVGFEVDGGTTITSVVSAVNGSLTQAVSSQLGAGANDAYVYYVSGITGGQDSITLNLNAPIAATAMVNGNNYTITTLGTTNWATFGAPAGYVVGTLFTATGAGTGTGTCTVPSKIFNMVVTELYGVAASSVLNGTSSNGVTPSTSTAVPSFTPGNNNANGGNFVWSYFIKSDNNPSNLTTGIFPGANQTILNADIGWNANPNTSLPKAVIGTVQATSAAIAPAIVSVAESGDNWNSLSAAFKLSPGGGTAPVTTIRFASRHHFSTISYPATGAYRLQVTAQGNLRVLVSTDPNLNATTVTDSEGNAYTQSAAGAGIWYCENTVPNPNLDIWINGGGGDPTLSWRFLDIANAITSPYDSSLANNQTVNFQSASQNTSTGVWTTVAQSFAAGDKVYIQDATPSNYSNGTPYYVIAAGLSSTTCELSATIGGSVLVPATSVSTFICPDHFTASPSPSAVSSAGIMICNLGLGQGPGLNTLSPVGSVWGLCTYTGEVDLDLVENADTFAYYLYGAAGSQTWTIQNTPVGTANNSAGGFISFTSIGSPLPTPWLRTGGMGQITVQ
jgi:hypothetical protein